MNKWVTSSLMLFGTLAVVACAGTGAKATSPMMPRPPVAPLVEQRISDLNRAKAEEVKYFDALAEAVRQESRYEAWASEMESKLRQTFADSPEHVSGTLKTVLCKRSKCEMELIVHPAQSPDAFMGQQRAINQWIAWSQPCAYAMTGREQSPNRSESIRIFVDCGT